MDTLDIQHSDDLCANISRFIRDEWNWRRYGLAAMRMLQSWRDELLDEECVA